MTAVGYVDLLIPRGGAGLIRACVENAKVPCIQTGTGICHIFVDDTADQAKALDIIENAKASRPSVCNAEEVCLVHSASCAGVSAKAARSVLAADRVAAGKLPVELRLDTRAAAIIPGTPAGPADFDTEFLDYILAVKVVDSVDEAIAHIAAALHRPQRGHPDPGRRQTPTASPAAVDSAAVYVNCLHPLYRRRGVWPGLRDGHLHPEAPRPGPHGAGRAVQLQVRHPRRRADPLSLPCPGFFIIFLQFRPLCGRGGASFS